MTTSKTSKGSMQLRLRGLIAGTQKHFPNGSLTFGGATYTPASLIQSFQNLDDATARMDAARAAWEDTVTAQRAVKATVDPLIKGYRGYLTTLYGNVSATLVDFGMSPRKERAPLTTAQQTAAVAKQKATRAARHTMGPKQKAGIKGTVPTPETTPAATTPATAGPAKPIMQ